ncbi:AAA family ATPase [Escherichia coli]|nr:AAA family ATPase [Salmonella enterica subsp. enterica serovar Thompson]EFE0683909.1 AAA family ATPase [Escherichia coli]EJM2215688.1 AAA family ATPase [Escherichia fergusonii]EGM6162581.1 AAA family ATPase [Escherichia coli]EHH2317874.1 AAA family ATPase [Escherichia coli]
MRAYHNDQPILGGQNDPDLLNRLTFANNLANILLLNNDDDCFTVSIEAEWGYGKTSVINLIKNALNEKDSLPIIIEYNPWLAGQPESLIQDFLLQFSSQLNIKDKSKVALKVSKELIAYSSLFSAAKLIPGAEPWASIIEKSLSRFGHATKKIAELKKLDLLDRKKQVANAIKKIKHPIIVIIDDIDRLTPSEAFQVLRLVKAVANFSGTSFLLAFDPNYLISVLDKNNIINPSEYINKIVQLRVSLPVISERGLNEIANSELEKLGDSFLTDKFEKDQERLDWIYHNYFKQLINNPRELKRFFNHLRFTLEQIKGQVCSSDLFSLSLIATKSNLIYEHIKNTPEAYIGNRLTINNLLMNKHQDIIKHYSHERCNKLNIFSQRERTLMQGLLEYIFPLLRPNQSYPYDVSDSDAAGRISAPQRLHIALHFKTPVGYISDHDILLFIEGKINREKFLEDVLSQNAEERFFEMMNIYTDACCKVDSFNILTCIYDRFLFSQELKSSLEKNYGLIREDPYRRMYWLTDKIISKSSEQYELIKKIIGRYENAPLGAEVLYNVRNSSNIQINKDQIVELENIFKETATIALNKKIFFDYHLESNIFFELKRISVEFTSEFLASILSEDGIIRLCEIIGETGRDSTNGPYVIFDEHYFGEILDVDEVRNKAKNIDISKHPTRIQAVLKSIADGKKYYLRDATISLK